MPTNVVVSFHKTRIRPFITYSCPAWLEVALSNVQEVQVLNNGVLRTTGKAPPLPPPEHNYSWPTKPPLVLPNLGEFIDTTDAKQALVVETFTVIYVRTRKLHTKGKANGAWP